MHRRQFLRQTSAGLAAALSPGAVFQAPAVADRRVEIESLMTRLHERQLFTGQLLVADKGSVIYEDAFGTADHRTGRPYIRSTPAPVWRRCRNRSLRLRS